jgi:hypothetical protein
VASLQLLRTGIASDVPGARLSHPAATGRAARALIARRIPSVQHANLRLHGAGLAITDAALLSDPSRNPLAYHVLSTAMLLRALRLLDPSAPRAGVLAARRALWALVALADPEGTVAWMGRGQEHTWTYAATLYAALAGAARFAGDKRLAPRLRRLAELTLHVLQTRLGETGLAVLPGPPRATLAGGDHTQDTIACNGLALAFVALAATETAAAAGPTLPLPAANAAAAGPTAPPPAAAAGPTVPLPAETGAAVIDPTAAGVAAMRRGDTWFAVHRAATHPRDARYDAGLLAARVHLGGRWVSVVGERPNTDAAARMPHAGPLLVRGGRVSVPAGRLRVTRQEIALHGAWGGGRAVVPAVWHYRAVGRGVALTSPCPRGAAFRLVEWAGADERVDALPDGIALPGRTLRFSRPVTVTAPPQPRASAAFERVRGLRIDARCDGRRLRVAWRAR